MSEGLTGNERLKNKWRVFVSSRDQSLRDDIVDEYLHHAKNVAVRIYALRRDNTVSFDDYLQYARVGLLEAVDKFDPTRNTSFPTYSSHRISGAILNGLAKESELAAQRSYWVMRRRERLNSIKRLSEDSDNVDPLERMVQVTMDLAIGFVLDRDLEELGDESKRSSPYHSAALMELSERVHLMLQNLPGRERALLQLHYLEYKEFKQIAAAWGLSKGRVSQLHAQALRRLRNNLSTADFVDRKL